MRERSVGLLYSLPVSPGKHGADQRSDGDKPGQERSWRMPNLLELVVVFQEEVLETLVSPLPT
jgi:hypothetical protein